ncbi:cadherin repeat domain-containing protein, partial [Candidatus Woesearchaeota archaeon]|nr:cadherin repeat domain-containing protein [Candidatus Woesearchaeota archaeon]
FAVNSATGIITNNTALSLGAYSLNISVNDSFNQINSSVIIVTVSDTTAPTWDQALTNQVVDETSSFSYDVNGSDADTVSYYINDTTNFAINLGTGVITNATALIAGAVYSLNVTLNDTSNNPASSTMTVTVNDITAPTWDTALANQSITEGNSFSYDVDASDNVDVDTYFINDTTNFAINAANGTITNNTVLSVGTYWLNVSVNDTSNNILSTLITVTVNTTPTPSSSGGSSSTQECRDNRDNDGDGLIDYPDDPGCSSKYDDDETDEACTENWYCISWTSCVDNQQTRICEDWNACRTEILKPAEIRECTPEEPIEEIAPPPIEEIPEPSPITGAAVAEEESSGKAGVIVFLMLIAMMTAIIYLIYFKPKNKF